MARLHLSELVNASNKYHEYCLCYVSSIDNNMDEEIYVPVTGFWLPKEIPIKRIYFPITTRYPEPITINGFSDNNYDKNRILILNGNSEALIIKNFIFYKDGEIMRIAFGKYAVYKIRNNIGVFKGHVNLIDGQFFKRCKNTKLKNFLFQKVVPNCSNDLYDCVKMWNFRVNSFVLPKMNTDMKFIEGSIKDSMPIFEHNILFNNKLGCKSILNSVALLKELSYVCSEESIEKVFRLVPNYMTKMSETEINSLSLPKITMDDAECSID